MKLGFVSAILPELDLAAVLARGRAVGYSAVELMCWPVGRADRRYAGVTHLDVADFGPREAQRVRELCAQHDMTISGLGYYPNPLGPDGAAAAAHLEHLQKVISASALLGVNQINTFIGRDPALPVAENWRLVEARWPAVIRHAEKAGVRIGIENCPMYFSQDEWPGGKNLPVSPRLWRELFRRLPSPNLGLNYDPSHLVWQQMDYIAPLREFGDRIFHVHAKDARVDRARLNDVGILATPLEYHEPRLPGRGDIDWPRFLRALAEAGYRGPVCVEFEDSLAAREAGLRQAAAFLQPLLPS